MTSPNRSNVIPHGIVVSRIMEHSRRSTNDDSVEPQTGHGRRLARVRGSDTSASLALSKLTPEEQWEFYQCPTPTECLQSNTARDAVTPLLELSESASVRQNIWENHRNDMGSLLHSLYDFEGKAISRIQGREKESTPIERLRRDESLAKGWEVARQLFPGHEDDVEQAWWGYKFADQTMADLPPWDASAIDQNTDQSFVASYEVPDTHTAIEKLRRKLDKNRHPFREPFEDTLDFDHVVSKTLNTMSAGKVPAALKIPTLRSTVQARLDFWSTMGESEAMAKYNPLAAPIASLWREQTRAEEERVEANKRSRRATVTAGSDVLTIASVD